MRSNFVSEPTQRMKITWCQQVCLFIPDPGYKHIKGFGAYHLTPWYHYILDSLTTFLIACMDAYQSESLIMHPSLLLYLGDN